MPLRDFLPARFKKDETVIPVVRLSGMIASGGTAFQPRLNLASCAGVLERAFKWKGAPAVAISINSPGGSPVQSRLIFHRIRDLAKEHDKKVFVFIEDVAASGGYMLSIAGDEIFADPTSIVGSIGVVAATFGFVEAIDKLGVERRVYTAGKNKVTLDPFQPEKKSDVDHLKKLQLEIHEVFIDMVKERRGGKLADNKDLFTGLYWTGTQAKELGLVDGIGHMRTVMKERYGDKTKLKLVNVKRGLLGRPQPVAGVSGVDLSGAGLSGVGAELAESLPNALVQTAEERALWARFGL